MSPSIQRLFGENGVRCVDDEPELKVLQFKNPAQFLIETLTVNVSVTTLHQTDGPCSDPTEVDSVFTTWMLTHSRRSFPDVELLI